MLLQRTVDTVLLLCIATDTIHNFGHLASSNYITSEVLRFINAGTYTHTHVHKHLHIYSWY